MSEYLRKVASKEPGITQKFHLTGHPHSRLGTHLGSVWLKMAHRNVLMGHIQDQTRVEGVFSKAYCFHSMFNGEKVQRNWLLYSKSTNKVYCFACKLFGGARVVDTRFVVGYNN